MPEACFRRYLVQDYLFLIHFARAWGLAIYKSDTLAEMRRAQRLVTATLDVEIGLHIDYCRGWGLSEAVMAAEPEALATIAYTRFVLDRGLAGDRLDLEVALPNPRPWPAPIRRLPPPLKWPLSIMRADAVRALMAETLVN